MLESHQHVTCRQVVDLVNDYLEQALPAEDTTLFEQHVNFCEGCAFYVDQMRRTVAVVGRVREDDVPPEARDRLLTAFREWRRS
jgi:anti-sigma factor (TIGR02949 family)